MSLQLINDHSPLLNALQKQQAGTHPANVDPSRNHKRSEMNQIDRSPTTMAHSPEPAQTVDQLYPDPTCDQTHRIHAQSRIGPLTRLGSSLIQPELYRILKARRQVMRNRLADCQLGHLDCYARHTLGKHCPYRPACWRDGTAQKPPPCRFLAPQAEVVKP